MYKICILYIFLIMFVTETQNKNMKTIIKRIDWLPRYKFFDFGWGNGYVLIPPRHPFYKKDSSEIDQFVNVNGGLTFSALVTVRTLKQFNIPKQYLYYWLVGFDTAHYWDNLERWPKIKVQHEADRLAAQLSKFYSHGKI